MHTSLNFCYQQILLSNESWTCSNNSVCIWKIMVNETWPMLFKIDVLQNFKIFTGKHLGCFLANIVKLFKNSFFYRSPLVAAFRYSNQYKIFQEISASKFQRQHAAQFTYEGLLLKRKQKRCKVHSDLCGFRFSHFPGQLFIISWNNLLSSQIFA